MSRIVSVVSCVLFVLLSGCSGSSDADRGVGAAAPGADAVHDSSFRLADLPEVDRPKVRKQRARLAEHDFEETFHRVYDEVVQDWTGAIDSLIESGQIEIGMSQSEILRLLGEPTGSGGDADRQWLRWYLDSPMHVNPAFDVELQGGKVTSFGFVTA